jgi:hypothetical protein
VFKYLGESQNIEMDDKCMLVLRTPKNTRTKGQRKNVNLIFKQGTKQDYMIQKQKHKK